MIKILRKHKIIETVFKICISYAKSHTKNNRDVEYPFSTLVLSLSIDECIIFVRNLIFASNFNKDKTPNKVFVP